VTHDRYFLNQVADRLIVVSDGRARVIEGDYETYQRFAAQEAEAAAAKIQAKAPAAVADDPTRGDRRKRKFPYRKPDDIESEIGLLEAEVAEMQDLLGQPATWRDPIRATDLQQRLGDKSAKLARLYEHWEEALELNV
jgi:ATP-binding cassette, subfamily F, member 3